MRFYGTATVIKRDKHLQIVVLETDAHLYTPPSFLCFHNRGCLQTLAAAFTQRQERAIDLITAFETVWNPRRKEFSHSEERPICPHT